MNLINNKWNGEQDNKQRWRHEGKRIWGEISSVNRTLSSTSRTPLSLEIVNLFQEVAVNRHGPDWLEWRPFRGTVEMRTSSLHGRRQCVYMFQTLLHHRLCRGDMSGSAPFEAHARS